MIIVFVLAFIIGLTMVVLTLKSALQTFVLPRAARDRITSVVFRAVRRLFELRMRWVNTYIDQDRIMGFYAPVSLLALVPVWLGLILLGFSGMFWALGVHPWSAAFWLSGSSLFTLGFATVNTLPQTILVFSEATIGLIMVALLIAYLPTMYSAFSRRETAITLLEVRAGAPPTAVELLSRFYRLNELNALHDSWIHWEEWFAELAESHTSLAALVFFRSPQPEHSWITAAGTVLDAAALAASTLDLPRDPQTELCLRAGYVALRHIASVLGVQYNAHSTFPQDPISITRQEFDDAYDRLAEQGIPLKPDRDQAWADFAGWRVNYDKVLLSISLLIMAPYAPWTSDRSPTLIT
jgi:hypothetical protein